MATAIHHSWIGRCIDQSERLIEIPRKWNEKRNQNFNQPKFISILAVHKDFECICWKLVLIIVKKWRFCYRIATHSTWSYMSLNIKIQRCKLIWMNWPSSNVPSDLPIGVSFSVGHSKSHRLQTAAVCIKSPWNSAKNAEKWCSLR